MGEFVHIALNTLRRLVFCCCSDPHLVCLEDYPIHTVTGLVKQWLRELPDPLMTFTHYNEFLHAVGEKDYDQGGAAFLILFTWGQALSCHFSFLMATINWLKRYAVTIEQLFVGKCLLLVSGGILILHQSLLFKEAPKTACLFNC